MKTKLFILSCLMICSSFVYQAYAGGYIVYSNIKFTYNGPTSFPNANSIAAVTFTFEGSDWSNLTGSCHGYVLLSKTSDFNLGDQNKNFYKAQNLGRCFKLVENSRMNGYGSNKVIFPEDKPGSKYYNNMIEDSNSKIPDGEYYMAVLFATTYKKVKMPDGTIATSGAYVVIPEKNNKKIYIGKKPVTPTPTCDINVRDFTIGKESIYPGGSFSGEVTVELTGVKQLDANMSITLYPDGGGAGNILTSQRVTLLQGSQKISNYYMVPSMPNVKYKSLEVRFVNNCVTCCGESNTTNNSKSISPPTIVQRSGLRSLELIDDIDQMNLSDLSAFWDNADQSAVKISVDEQWIGKEIYIVNVTRNAFVAKREITATEFSVSVANAVRKGDIISIYVNGTEQSSKLLKTH
ncbi:MAG: hypothetical protein LBV72_17515 [Tannerella sp.]|jgi:hypothetical protein|nr:hypothetical protein [Tannerella sp.]